MEWILILTKGFFGQDFLVLFKGMDSYIIFQAFLKKVWNSNRLRRATNFLVVKYAEESDSDYSLKGTTEEYWLEMIFRRRRIEYFQFLPETGNN